MRAQAKATLPPEDATKNENQASGVIGNVIRLTWKEFDQPSELGAMLAKTGNLDEGPRFCLGGVVLVGRRVNDPMWHTVLDLRTKILEQRELLVKRRLVKVKEQRGIAVMDVVDAKQTNLDVSLDL